MAPLGIGSRSGRHGGLLAASEVTQASAAEASAMSMRASSLAGAGTHL